MGKNKRIRSAILSISLALAMILSTVSFAAPYEVYADGIETVTVGTGTEASDWLPHRTDFKYSRTQIIYDAESIGKDGTILSVAYEVAEASEGYSIPDMKIWMGYTDLDRYDYDSTGSAARSVYTLREPDISLVYHGSPEIGTETGWQTIELDEPFEYVRSNGNLVIVTSVSGVRQGSSVLKYYCTVYGNGFDRSMLTALEADDSNDPTIADPAAYSGTNVWRIRSSRPNIRLELDTSGGLEEYHRVTFDADGGKPRPAAQRILSGEKAERPSEDPVKEGCEFTGWFNGDSLYDFDSPVTAPLNLRAKWEKKKYTVTFVDEDGETVLQTSEVEHGDKPEYTGETPAKASEDGTEYVFAGWDPAVREADSDQTYRAVYIDKAELADKSELEERIKEATDAKTGIRTADDGSEIGKNFRYVTAEQMDAYNAAIDAAQRVVDDPYAKQEEVDQALADLETAMAGFAESQQNGTKEPPAITEIVISRNSGRQQPAAGGTYEWKVTFEEGTDLSALPESRKVTDDDFQIQRKPYGSDWKNSKCPYVSFSVSEAAGERNVGYLTGMAIPDNTKETDTTNLWRFIYSGDSADCPVITQDGYSNVDKTELENAISEAETAADGIKVSEDGMDVDPEDIYVTPSEKQALDSAIDAAQKTANNGRVSQAQVDEAVRELNAAVAAFNDAKKHGGNYDPTGGYEQGDYRLLYEEATVTLPDIPVRESLSGQDEPEWFTERPVEFEFYNSTTQKSEGVYTTAEGSFTDEGGAEHTAQILSGVQLTRGQHYIVSAHDKEYTIANYYEVTIGDDGYGNSRVYTSNMVNYYIHLDADGAYPADIKKGGTVKFFDLEKRPKALRDITDGRRVNVRIPVFYTQDGTAATILALVPEAVIKLSSPEETLYVTSDDNGYISAGLIEDVDYMVQVVEDSGAIGLASFPLVVKDHAENGWPKSIYNHFSCGSVQGIYLVDKNLEHAKDTTLVSLSKKTSVTGMNFMNDMPTDTDHYFINDRELDKSSVSGLKGKEYETFIVEAINMYRTEASRLAAGTFVITRDIPWDKNVSKVYYVNRSGKLRNLAFSEKDGKVEFEMDTLSMYPNVIVYKDKMGEDGTALGKGAPVTTAEKAVSKVGVSSDASPAGTVFRSLRLRSAKQGKTSVALSWAKVKGAKKYILYGNLSGKGHAMKKITESSKASYTVKKAAGKALKAGKYYKFMLVAVDADNKVVSASKVIHVATKGGKAGNYKAVKTKAKDSKVSVKKGKSFSLGASQIPADKKLKVKKYAGLRYESSATSVATVSSRGVIKGKKKGTCYVYAYTQSGTYKKIKVTVR